MEHFIVNSSVCLFVLWLFYKLVLENTSWHHWKRFYLLGAIGVSLIIPFIVVETIVIPLQNNPLVGLGNLNSSETIVEDKKFEINWLYVWMGIYFIGVAIMLWRFGKNIYSFRIKNDDQIDRYSIYQLILRQGITVPHSFFNRIFVSATDRKKDLIPDAVLKHEKAHLDQKHSVDILLIELLLILFWFNPLFYMIRYSIKLNHEFLADRSVIQQGFSTHQYQELILEHATNSYQQSIANTFHFPIIKKRFSIMKTKTSKTSGLMRSLAIIPVLTLLILSCGKEEIQLEKQKEASIIEKEFKDKIIVLENSDQVTIDGQEYSFKNEDGKYHFYDSKGEQFDYKSKGYQVLFVKYVPEESNLNLPQQIVKFVDNSIDDNKTFLIDGKKYSVNEMIKRLNKYPNATVNLGFKYNEKSIINVDTSRFQSDKSLQNTLNILIEETKGKPFAEQEITEYNRLAKKHKAYMDEHNTLIVWKDETSLMQDIYHSMTKEQQLNNEPWPYLGRANDVKPGQVPPPPPPN
jgi:hypothetical protein